VKRAEFDDEAVTGICGMNMYEEDSGSDTGEVNSLQGLGEIVA
jgi:hypothetical protein